MNHSPLHTPVALILFKRSEPLQQVFAQIREQQPKKLFLIADGPRQDIAGEVDQCKRARKVVAKIDWPCDVTQIFSDTNMGCGRRMATGINQVFEQVERAIFFEDDCVPHPSFFRFCEELLDHYAEDDQVMHIAGSRLGHKTATTPASYYFSQYMLCWGWASWRRAWQKFDFELKSWAQPHNQHAILDRAFTDDERAFYKRTFNNIASGKENEWCQQWLYACLLNNGLCINPAMNLISNIGIDEHAVHTIDNHNKVHFLKTHEMPFPLRHPEQKTTDSEADQEFAATNFSPKKTPWLTKMTNSLKKRWIKLEQHSRSHTPH